MDRISLSRLAELAGGHLLGDPAASVGPKVVIDSRLADDGALFVALPGERVDGHDYLGAAREQGAVAALVTRAVEDQPIHQVVVADGVEGLTRLATALTAEHVANGLQVVGITGSSGKTTTKDMTAALLERAGETISPPGSFNNEIGLPLTALGVGRDTRFLVAEMGAQRMGEIERLCGITPPRVGIVLNVGHAHLGEFGGVANIVEAKSELVEALPADGWAVLNALDENVWGMRERTAARVVAGAVGERPEHPDAVWAEDVTPDALERCSFTLRAEITGAGVTGVSLPVQLPLVGRHMVSNAVQAAAAALVLGVDATEVRAGLNALAPRSRWRMALSETPAGYVVINDAYNANPESMTASLRSLKALAAARLGGRTWALLGDMLELGEDSAREHRAVGEQAAFVDEVIGVGQFGDQIVAGAGKGRVVADGPAALELLRAAIAAGHLSQGDIVLVKGSNSVALGPVGDTLVAEAAAGGERA